YHLLEHMRFRAGYDFLLLRCEAGEVPQEVGDWWTRFIDADTPGREELIRSLAPQAGTGPKRKRRRSSGRSAGDASDALVARADSQAADEPRGSAAGTVGAAGEPAIQAAGGSQR